jgi:KUP system potassium uptake protein
MRTDNDGEGGILTLMSLLGIKHGNRSGVIAIGLLGAALLYGDGTPAISVLSPLEGLKLPVPAIGPYVVPLSVAILVAIFALQPRGANSRANTSRRPRRQPRISPNRFAKAVPTWGL